MIIDDSLFIMRLEDDVDRQKADFELLDKALGNSRLRESYDLRTSSEKGNQCIFNTFILGTIVPIHHHPNSNENTILLCGKLVAILYVEEGNGICAFT